MSVPTTVRSFKGLNNVSDPLRTGVEWLQQADNVDVTDSGSLVVRKGYSAALSGSITGAYATLDTLRMYVVDGGALKAMTSPGSAVTLATGLSSAPMHFTETNNDVYFNNGTDAGIVGPDNQVQPWRWDDPAQPNVAAVDGALDPGLYQVRCVTVLADGRTTGASTPTEITLVAGQALQISGIQHPAGCTTRVYIAPANSAVYGLAFENAPASVVWNQPAVALGREITDAMCAALPIGADVVQAWRGRIFAAVYFPALGQTAVFGSLPLGFHLFDLAGENVFLVPGRVLMMAPHADGLIVGTDQAIHSYTPEKLMRLAPYGVVPGWHWSADDDGRVLFSTLRGICAALPFSNLTESSVSVAPGVSAGGAIVRSEGQKRYLVALKQGGIAFNQRN